MNGSFPVASEKHSFLVFVHGYPFDGRMWSGQAPLGRTRRLITPDLPGFGKNPAPPSDATLGAYADAVLRSCDEAGCRRAVFCGLSMGGYILFEIWRRARERVEAMILCDTRAEADTPEARKSREDSMAKTRRGRWSDVTADMLPRLLGSDGLVNADLRRRVIEMMSAASAEGVLAALQALRDRPDSRPTLKTIDAPVLIVVGSEDLLTPPPAARFMCARIHGSRLIEIPCAGHLAPMEKPEAFNPAVEEFLRKS